MWPLSSFPQIYSTVSTFLRHIYLWGANFCKSIFFVQFSKTIRQGGGHNLLKFDMTSISNQEFFWRAKQIGKYSREAIITFFIAANHTRYTWQQQVLANQKVGAGRLQSFPFSFIYCQNHFKNNNLLLTVDKSHLMSTIHILKNLTFRGLSLCYRSDKDSVLYFFYCIYHFDFDFGTATFFVTTQR